MDSYLCQWCFQMKCQQDLSENTMPNKLCLILKIRSEHIFDYPAMCKQTLVSGHFCLPFKIYDR